MLVVDDTQINIEILKDILGISAILCDSALSGTIALQMIQERILMVKEGTGEIYKVILLDFSMPVMDGPATAMELRRVIAESGIEEQPYICCCSAYTEDNFIEEAFEAGMDKYFTKPVNADLLLEAVKFVLDQ